MAPSRLFTALRRTSATVVLGALLGSCGTGGEEFYPLDEGRWWFYETRTTVLDETREQRLAVANLGGGTFDGADVRIQRQSSGREVYFRETDRGLERVAVRQPAGAEGAPLPATLILPRARQAGESWTTHSRLRLIESRTFARQDKLRNRMLPLELAMTVGATGVTVTVPAGSFARCIRIDGRGTRSVRTDRGNAVAEVTVEHAEWYAPGVGLVKLTRSESADSPFLKAGRYVQELVQYE